MCGIVGYWEYGSGRTFDSGSFARLVDTLAHRGPDDKGIYQGPGIGLGHRRLAIIDISQRGRQPMSSPDNQVWLVYNGEIYNFNNLKKELEKQGSIFISTSDTEVLLHAYLRWDLECLKRLNGIFAFAIWDERYPRLWLVRDQIGVKPLYFSDYGGRLAFASEISALLAFPDIPKDPDLEGLDAYFSFGYVPAPRTGFKYIQQLLPGQYLLLDREGKRLTQYWDLALDKPQMRISPGECMTELDRVFTETVKRQMVSDVPLGAFLSSGTDSFAVVRAMQKNSTGKVTAYSIGFEEKAYDELPYTRMAAEALGVDLVSQRLRVDFRRLLEKIPPHCQDPFADSSCLPVYLLCEMAAKHVKVALSGDGGDELLAGYQVYKANRYAELYRQLPRFIRDGLVKPLVRLAPDMGGKYTYQEKLRRFLYGAEKAKFQGHASWRIIIPQEVKQKIYTPEFWRAVKDHDPVNLYTAYMEKAKNQGCSDLQSYLYADLKFYLPNDMLVKVDRMSMAHGLEVRVPFLDLEMVNFCWRIPDNLKLRNGQPKYILRQVIGDLYPPVLQKLPKSGFNMPPYADLLPPINPQNAFYDFRRMSKQDYFSNYSHFLVRFNQFMFDYINNKYQFPLH